MLSNKVTISYSVECRHFFLRITVGTFLPSYLSTRSAVCRYCQRYLRYEDLVNLASPLIYTFSYQSSLLKNEDLVRRRNTKIHTFGAQAKHGTWNLYEAKAVTGLQKPKEIPNALGLYIIMISTSILKRYSDIDD